MCRIMLCIEMMHPGPGRLESNVRKALCSQSCMLLLELEPNQSVNTWWAPGANLQFLPNSKMSVYVQWHQPLNQTKGKSLLCYSSTRRELYWDDISQFTYGWMTRVIYGNLYEFRGYLNAEKIDTESLIWWHNQKRWHVWPTEALWVHVGQDVSKCTSGYPNSPTISSNINGMRVTTNC
jgi:hypothetical protein